MKLYIYEARTKANLSLQELSKKSGVAKSYLQKLEDVNGNANPSLKIMCKLAKALNVTINELFDCEGS